MTDCGCKYDWDVRSVCAFKSPEWKTCPVKYQTAVFYIDNDEHLSRRAQMSDFLFLNHLVDDDVIEHGDAHKICYYWNKSWLEHEYDWEEPVEEPKDLLKALKKCRDQEIVDTHRISMLEKLYTQSLDDWVQQHKL